MIQHLNINVTPKHPVGLGELLLVKFGRLVSALKTFKIKVSLATTGNIQCLVRLPN